MKEDREHLILRYLQGNLSEEEQRAFELWQNESDENRKMVADFHQIWQTTIDKEHPTDFQSEQEWQKLAASLFAKEKSPVRKLNLFQEPWLKIAATVLLICLCAFIVYLNFFKADSHLIQTAESIRHTVLPDGSDVWLNAESQLTYNSDFAKNRLVKLEGEAFFDVKKDAERPFTIHTNDAQVMVLGTSFNVRAYGREILTEVFVLTGKVSVKPKDDGKNIILTPGSTGVLSRSDHTLAVNTEEDPNRLAWKNKELVFKKAPLRTVVKTLSSYFKKDFRIQNKELSQCRFTGSFKDPSLDEVLESLSIALDLKMDRQEDAYVFDGPGCKMN
jgi:transmembrane sensor